MRSYVLLCVVLFWLFSFGVVSFVVCFVFCVLCVWCARVPVCVLPLLGKEFHDVPNYTAGR